MKIFCQSAENFQYAFHFSLSIAFYIIVYYLGLYSVIYAIYLLFDRFNYFIVLIYFR